MAQSPAHKFGQIIGDLLENSMEVPLRSFVNKNPRLYLDKKGNRPARGTKKKVAWTDLNGNVHDLDFVIELDGSEHKIGTPAVFIEIAWRRYTKHSRNKAQEIQGAIAPLFETYKNYCPFIGVVLGGVFTTGSLKQLESLGFKILYFNYDTIVEAFDVEGIDAFFDEDTDVQVFQQKVDAVENLTPQQVQNIKNKLIELKSDEINNFIKYLSDTVARTVSRVIVIAIHGDQYEVNSIQDAIDYISNYKSKKSVNVLLGFDIYIKFNNGDRIEANFNEKERAIQFLSNYK